MRPRVLCVTATADFSRHQAHLPTGWAHCFVHYRVAIVDRLWSTLSMNPIECVTGSWAETSADWLIVPIGEETGSSTSLAELDSALGGLLMQLRESGDLRGKAGETVPLHSLAGVAASRIMLTGFGNQLTPITFQHAVMTALRQVTRREGLSVVVAVPDSSEVDATALRQLVTSAAVALHVGSATPALYRTEPSRFPLAHGGVSVGTRDPAECQPAATTGDIIGQSVNLARELVNRHPGELYPESFAQRASQLAQELNLTIDILDERRLAEERMYSLLGVAQGSSRPPRVVWLEYRGKPLERIDAGHRWQGSHVRQWRAFAQNQRRHEDDEIGHGWSGNVAGSCHWDCPAAVACECRFGGRTCRKHAWCRSV